MKAITLWQPWESLIMTGAKKFETRSWATRYRGPLVICSAKGGLSKLELLHEICCEPVASALLPIFGGDITRATRRVKVEDLPFGMALGIVELIDCIRTDDLTLAQVNGQEPFGDFSIGRFAWKLENIRRFKNPFPALGRQGFFDVDVTGNNVETCK